MVPLAQVRYNPIYPTPFWLCQCSGQDELIRRPGKSSMPGLQRALAAPIRSIATEPQGLSLRGGLPYPVFGGVRWRGKNFSGGFMRAEIISCGTELLLGQITDTNATYLSQSFAALGIDLYYVSQVGDNLGRIVETLQRAWQRSDLIVMTGGLGPTEDDLARESISALLGETMQIDPQLEEI